MADKISIARIALLAPYLRVEAREILDAADKVLTGRAQCRYTHTLRTCEEQDKLYAQGRTVPGNIVTWARGGDSLHNYGLAIDICLIVDGKEASWDTLADYDGDGVADWMEVVGIFERHGWTWGGRWAKPKTDMPHFQKTLGYSIAQLKAMSKVKGYVILG